MGLSDYGNVIIGNSGIYLGFLILAFLFILPIHLYSIWQKKDKFNWVIFLILPVAYLGVTSGNNYLDDLGSENKILAMKLVRNIEQFRLDNGRLPNNLEQLTTPKNRKYKTGIWKTERFEYFNNGSGSFTVYYYDNDGVENRFDSRDSTWSEIPFSF